MAATNVGRTVEIEVTTLSARPSSATGKPHASWIPSSAWAYAVDSGSATYNRSSRVSSPSAATAAAW